MQKLLGDERAKNLELRAQLAETNNLKVYNIQYFPKHVYNKPHSQKMLPLKVISHEQRRKIDDLSQTVSKLLNTKDKQKQKLSGLKHSLKFTEHETSTEKDRMLSQMNAVTDDLQSTKIAFEEVSRREKQVT